MNEKRQNAKVITIQLDEVDVNYKLVGEVARLVSGPDEESELLSDKTIEEYE